MRSRDKKTRNMNKKMRSIRRILAGALTLALLVGQASAGAPNVYRSYYEIFVGGFYDSDGDGVGDLTGVTRQLDVLSATDGLGIDGIWLMPIMPSPTYHKYDVIDYQAIDPQYGTMADFDALLAACESRDIAVLMDLVLNHTSNEHPWFQAAARSIVIPSCGQTVCAAEELCSAHNPLCGYYHFAQQGGGGYHRLGGGWWYQGVFGEHMPDLNLESELLRQEIKQIVAFWLAKGVAGFRLDAVTEYYDGNIIENVGFLAWLRKEMQEIKPDVYLVGEAWRDAGSIVRYYESGIDSFFNFPFAQAEGVLVKAVRGGQGQALAEKIAGWQAQIRAANPLAIDAPFLSNHDHARSAGFLMRNAQMEKMCAAVYLLMPGNPFLYYGEEIGMTGSGRDENKRQPMIWSVTDAVGRVEPPEGADQSQELSAGVAEQRTDAQSLWRFYQRALALRKVYPTIARGTVQAVQTEYPALCGLLFVDAECSVMVLHNLGKQEIRMGLPKVWGKETLGGSLDTDGQPVTLTDGVLVMPPLSTAILK